MDQVRWLVFRQLHANVWGAIRAGPASPCLAGYVPKEKPGSIFISEPEILKQCSTRSSKGRLVWVCARPAMATAMRLARKGAFKEVMEQGPTSMVLSESMDGGRIRLVEPLPFAGQVIVKLLMPVFAQQFLYECLKAAPGAMTPALTALLALGDSRDSDTQTVLQRSQRSLQDHDGLHEVRARGSRCTFRA